MKTKGILAALLLAISACLHGQEPATRPKVGLVLSGGGAKSAAQIGFLKYLEEIGIPIDYVTGTSMGAIVGGFYALGYNATELEDIIKGMDWNQYMSNATLRDRLSSQCRNEKNAFLLTIPFNIKKDKVSTLQGDLSNAIVNQSFISSLPSSLIDGTKITNILNSYSVGYQDSISFNDLPISYACVVTDYKTGEEVVLNSGSLPWAMRASMSIPGLFSPVRINGMLLVDGGLSNIIPADVCKEMGADILIGIETTDGLIMDDERLQSLPQLALQFINLTVNGKAETNRKRCDLYIHPDVKGYNMLSFEKSSIDTLIQRGYQAAVLNKDKLIALKEMLDSYPAEDQGCQHPKAVSIKGERFTLHSITFNTASPQEQRWLQRKGHLKVGVPMDGDKIEKAIDIYDGSGYYSKTTYTITETPETAESDSIKSYDLDIHLNRTAPHSFGLGFRYDTEESAALLFSAELNRHRPKGLRLSLNSKLSYNPHIGTTLTWAQRGLACFNLSYEYRSSEFKVSEPSLPQDIFRLRSNTFKLYVTEFYLRDIEVAAGVKYESFPMAQTYVNEKSAAHQYYGPYLTFTFDNMDNAYFSRRGVKVALAAHLLKANGRQDLFGDIFLKATAPITPFDSRLTLIPQVYLRGCLGSDIPLVYRNFAGGSMEGRYLEQQIPFIGILHTTSPDNYAAVARLDIRYNIFGRHYISGIANYMRHAVCMTDFMKDGGAASQWGAGLRYTFDSPIGPISLDGQWSDLTQRFCVYFNLGYTF